MDRVDALLQEYRRQLSLPWRRDVAGPERVWIAVYPPEIERRLRPRIPEFEIATREAGHKWQHLDLTPKFAQWLAGHEYRDEYFAEPDQIKPALVGFERDLQAEVRALLTAEGTDQETVVALSGVGALFPMVQVSTLVAGVASGIRGRLLVFFPGAFERGNYRLLDARDGWNYLAIPITIPEGAGS